MLSDVSFSVMAGEVVALIGPSGAGKTRLFRCLTRLTEVDDGEIHLLGRSIKLMRSGQLRAARRDIGLVL